MSLTSSASTTTLTSSGPLATSSTYGSGSGLSSGAIAGISVDWAMGGILLVGAIVGAFCIGRGQERGGKGFRFRGVDAKYAAEVDQQLHFLGRDARLTSEQVNELDVSGEQVNELGVSGAMNELDSRHLQ